MCKITLFWERKGYSRKGLIHYPRYAHALTRDLIIIINYLEPQELDSKMFTSSSVFILLLLIVAHYRALPSGTQTPEHGIINY